MKMVALPKGKQYGINGACVNVPTRLDSICSLLPRMPEEAQILDLKLKQKLVFKGHRMHSMIDPGKVIKALKWLKQNNPKYKDVDIMSNFEHLCYSNKLMNQLSKNAVNEIPFQIENNEDTEDCGENDTQLPKEDECTENTQNVEDSERNTEKDLSDKDKQLQKEDEEIFHTDQEEADRMASISLQPLSTCLQLDDINNKTFCVAPGENQKPIYILKDDDFETLSFPDLFPYGRGGFVSDGERETKVHWREYFNQRLLHFDGRFSRTIEYLFSGQFLTERKQVDGSVGIKMQLKKGDSFKGKKVNAGFLKTEKSKQELLYDTKAFQWMKNIRGTPAFWRKQLQEGLAMVRTLGPPTWFVTFSAAEYHWPEIIQAVCTQYGESVTESEVEKMDWETKSMWLRRNPVTVVRAFEHRFSSIHKYMCSEAQPIGDLCNFAEQVEFQARGSPHIHAVYWAKNSPVINVDSDDEICGFFDKYISACLPKDDTELHELVATRQKHKCGSSYCTKKRKRVSVQLPKISVFENCNITTNRY